MLIAILVLAGCTRELASVEPRWHTVDLEGRPVGSRWGEWSAQPGDRNVTARNLLQLDASTPLRVGFEQTAFHGVDDPRTTIPIAGNVAIGWYLAAAPSARETIVWTAGSEAVVPLSAATPRAFVTYKIAEIGSPLPAQAYVADLAIEEAS